MSRLAIEFHLIPHIGGVSTADAPPPIPASQAFPARLKRSPTEIEVEDEQKLMTVKKCPPFIDAMIGGYLIPLIADVQFSMKPDGLEFGSTMPIVEHHDPRQLAGSPFQQMVIIKFLNPWIIKTPPSYSCLITVPLNRFEVPFQPLSGIVETDRFYHEIHFPAISLLAPGQSVTVKRGTPLVQVIPFKRDEWAATHMPADVPQRDQWEVLGERVGRYKANNWQRKSFE